MAGLASLLSRRQAYGPTMGDLTGGGGRSVRPRIRRNTRLRGTLPTRAPNNPVYPANAEPPGGKTGGVVGYQGGGRTMNPRAAGAAAMLRNRPAPYRPLPFRPGGYNRGQGSPIIPPGGWQEGGPVGAAPEEVAMASEIFARATPEQQAQITGGGGGPGMMDEEAAIGEALAMAMGGGGGGPPMGGGGPPMNGAPPMGGLI